MVTGVVAVLLVIGCYIALISMPPPPPTANLPKEQNRTGSAGNGTEESLNSSGRLPNTSGSASLDAAPAESSGETQLPPILPPGFSSGTQPPPISPPGYSNVPSQPREPAVPPSVSGQLPPGTLQPGQMAAPRPPATAPAAITNPGVQLPSVENTPTSAAGASAIP